MLKDTYSAQDELDALATQQDTWIPLDELVKEVGVIWNGNKLVLLTKSPTTGGWVKGTTKRPELMEIISRHIRERKPGVSRIPPTDAFED